VSEPVLYPWQQAAWTQLHAKPPTHHAWLLSGPTGIGKWAFATALAKARLCLQPLPDHHACGECAACKLHATHAHPDFLTLTPEALRTELGLPEPVLDKDRKPSKEIRVDDVRDVVQAFTRTTHLPRGRVCIVYPAERMNSASANTLLKTLEEPPEMPGGVLFIVVAHEPQQLLATVRSRCQAMPAPQPSAEQAQAWLVKAGVDKAKAAAALAMTGNRPLAVVQAGGGVLASTTAALDFVAAVARKQWAVAAKFDGKTHGNPAAVEALMRWLADVAMVKAGASGARYFPALNKECADWARATGWEPLRAMQTQLAQAAQIGNHPVISPLFIEALLVRLHPTL
jgi:DNA polymerase III subunit delta'